MNSEEFQLWLEECVDEHDAYVVENDTEEPTKASLWSPEKLYVPAAVTVNFSGEATGNAPAVEDKDVEGWYKYDVEL